VSVLGAGDRIERFRIDSVLSEQGGAAVYAGTEDETSRAVAITVIDGVGGDDASLRARAERAEQVAGLARIQSVEPITIGRLADGRAFVVNERLAALPIIPRSQAPIGAVFGSVGGDAPMDAGRAVLALTSQRAHRRVAGRVTRLARRVVGLAIVVGVIALAWVALR
jgi:hypothetical protein